MCETSSPARRVGASVKRVPNTVFAGSYGALGSATMTRAYAASVSAAPLMLPGGVRATILVRGDQTEGSLTVMSDCAPAGWCLPPHRHAGENETIHVTKGRLWMVIDGERRVLAPGDTAHVPAGVLHEGGTEGDGPVERLIVFSPGGMERLFEQLAETTDPEEAFRLATAFGWTF